jgi:hypothetical protein
MHRTVNGRAWRAHIVDIITLLFNDTIRCAVGQQSGDILWSVVDRSA